MLDSAFSPNSVHKVLEAVDQQCGYKGSVHPVLIEVEGMASDDIATACQLLQELGLIETVVWESKTGSTHVPTRITNRGIELLNECNKSFWEHAQHAFVQAAGKLAGFDLTVFVAFFQTTWTKYQQESLRKS